MKKFFSIIKNVNFSRLFNLHKYKNEFIFGVALGVFVFGNILLNPVALKLDLSKGKAYSLSSSSKKILKSLKDKVTISFYLSSEIPTRLIPLKQDVGDFLKEYEKTNKQKIAIRVIDPKKDSKSLQEASQNGIPELQFSQLSADRYALSTFYFGIVISKGDQKEVLPQVTDSESLEYNLTSAIYKLTNKNLGKISIIGKTQGFDPQTAELNSLNKLLEQQFEVEFSEKIATGSQAALVFDDNLKKYEKEELDLFKEYLNEKGKMVFFVDGVWVSDSLTSSVADHNLFDFFKEYGLTINQDLVLSANSELVNFGNSQVAFLIPYPFWIKINNFNDKSSLFSNITTLTFPWTSSITTSVKKNQEVTNLVFSTERSWVEKIASANPIILDPQSIKEPVEKDLKSRLLVTSVKLKNGGEFILIPSSRFVLERYLGRNSNNLEFILNIINNFASEGVLSGVRQRTVSFYPLPALSPASQQVFKYLNILLLPVVFSLYGLRRLLKKI